MGQVAWRVLQEGQVPQREPERQTSKGRQRGRETASGQQQQGAEDRDLPLFWREAAPWSDPLVPVLGIQDQPMETVVSLGKVNPVALATCHGVPAHCVLTLRPHVGGEGARGTLTLLPERSAD